MAGKHHFVPQFYLNAFKDPNSQDQPSPYLWVADVQQKTVKRRSAKNVAYITGFYEWKELKDEAPSIELIYSQIESRTAHVIRKVRSGILTLTDREKYDFSIFLGLQLTRTPRFRQASQDALKNHALKLIDSIIEDKGKLQKFIERYNGDKRPGKEPFSVEHVTDFIKNKRFNIVPNPDRTLQMTLRAGLEFSELIFIMDWLFILASDKARFFTCDVPLALLTPDAKPGKIDLEGYHNPELELSFPISPVCMLIMRGNNLPKTPIYANDGLVNEINRRIFPVVDRYVFCSSEDQAIWALEQRN